MNLKLLLTMSLLVGTTSSFAQRITVGVNAQNGASVTSNSLNKVGLFLEMRNNRTPILDLTLGESYSHFNSQININKNFALSLLPSTSTSDENGERNSNINLVGFGVQKQRANGDVSLHIIPIGWKFTDGGDPSKLKDSIKKVWSDYQSKNPGSVPRELEQIKNDLEQLGNGLNLAQAKLAVQYYYPFNNKVITSAGLSVFGQAGAYIDQGLGQAQNYVVTQDGVGSTIELGAKAQVELFDQINVNAKYHMTKTSFQDSYGNDYEYKAQVLSAGIGVLIYKKKN